MNQIIVNNIKMFVRPGTCDEGVVREVIESDCYGLHRINLRDQPNIVDVGGHVGSFTRLVASRWPAGKFYTYEANSNNFDIIEKNLKPLKKKATLYKGALVGKIPTNRRLVISANEKDTITGGWGINFNETAFEELATVATQVIENFYSLSDLLVTLDKIDILKLDCEGSEFSIIHSLSDAELYKIDYIVAEVHCGATSHTPINYDQFRTRILNQFICPELEARPDVTSHALFNITACNRKLIPNK
jgi:FkbM family methyltransferase